MTNNKDSGWWDHFFSEFRPFFDQVPAKETNAQVKYYIKKLNLKKGSKFLDCPIGIGRTAIPMAKKGIKITGVDITLSYLKELEEKVFKKNLPIKLLHRDMRRIDFENEFDAAGNLWTSFGYFEKESDNLLVLKKMFKALKPGGKFIIQLINRDWIIKYFTPKGWEDLNGVKLIEEREFDYKNSVNRTVWTFLKNGKEERHEINLRMYSYHELVALFEKVGFIDVEGFGSIKEEPISYKTRDMFVIGTKPK